MKPLDIPISSIRVMLARARPREEWEQIRASMQDVGLLVPVHVRDLGRTDAKGVRYELICGEGRVEAARSLCWETIPALVIEAEDAEVAGRFLAENMIRKAMPWAQKGRMIRDELASGAKIEDVAKRLHISVTLATKYLRVVSKLAQDDDRATALPVNDAEVLATLPANGQRIVLDIAEAKGQPVREIAKAARKAVDDGAGWTKAGLEKAFRAKDEELAKLRERLKVLRLYRAIGPGNVERLLSLPKFRAAIKAAKVNVSRFLP